MKEFNYIIKSENGIHARPAGMLVKRAAEFNADIKVILGEKSADAKRLFSVMGLGAKKDDQITVRVEYSGRDGDNREQIISEEERAANAIQSFLEENF